MLSVLRNKSLDLLDTIVTTLEQYDDVKSRPRVFAKTCMHEEEEEDQDMKESDVKEGEPQAETYNRFKHLSFELIDIGLH